MKIPSISILEGDCLHLMKEMPDQSVHCVVTSPPYWGLRDYGCDGQIGLEPSLDEFIGRLVAVFAEVYRVLRIDGTCWINMGDSYASNGGSRRQGSTGQLSGSKVSVARNEVGSREQNRQPPCGLRPKNLIGQPWRLAFALQDAGWYLRQDIIWHKPSPLPESVRDRCTKAHEYLFLLTKSEKYFWDFEAMQEPVSGTAHPRMRIPYGWGIGQEPRSAMDFQKDGVHPKARALDSGGSRANGSFSAAVANLVNTRNRRSVWTIASEPYAESHFATFPTALVRPCILAGCPPNGTVLDPFGGSGTTAVAAIELGRSAILCELNPEYVQLAKSRVDNVTPGLALIPDRKTD